jgi:hypothetical protein
MLLGVRDQVGLATRLRGNNDRVEFRERDMNDMFWEIPKEEAMAAIRWAMTTLREKTRGKKAWFSIARGGEKDLDRVGSCSSKNFYVLPEHEVVRFVDFDLHCNTLLHLGSVILSQGSKGVPIGGFLSAQIAELCAAWREFRFLFSPEAHVLQKKVQSGLDNAPPLQSFVQARGWHFSAPGIPQVIDYHPESVLSPSEGIHIAKQVHQVTTDTLTAGRFTGWWSPTDRIFAQVSSPAGTESVLFVNTTPWDGATGGRVQTVIKHSTRRNRGRVQRFFASYDPLQAVLGEILRPSSPCADARINLPESVSDKPIVCFSRYRDNIYIVLVKVGEHLLPLVEHTVASITNHLYGIPLKWEEWGPLTTWGEGSIIVKGVSSGGTTLSLSMSLVRKGTTHDLPLPNPGDPEWLQWVHRESPHASKVWKSQFPSLIYKSIWYASTERDLLHNFRSLMTGIGQCGFPQSWWRAPLRRLFDRLRMERFVTMRQLLQWKDEGRGG